MLRPTLALLSLAAAGHASAGTLDILGPGTDITDSVNYSSFVFFDWNGDGKEEVAGVDSVKSRLYLGSVDFPGMYIGEGTALASGLDHAAVSFSADTDGDAKSDLILVDGTRLRVWKSRSRPGLTAAAPDIDRELPSGVIQGSYPPVLADLDRDGSPDLFLPEEPGLRSASIIFSFTTATPLLVGLPEDSRATRVGPPWTAGGSPTLVSGDGSFHGGTVRIYVAGQDRTISFVADTHKFGTLVELDGEAPPELFGIEHNPIQGTVHYPVFSLSSGAWTEVSSLGSGSPFPAYPPEQAVLDADNDGRQELYVCSPGEKRLQVLRSSSTAAASSLVNLPESARPLIGLSEVRVPSLGRSLLALHSGSLMCLRYFVGFDLWHPGHGLQPAVRLSPLFTGYATDRNVPIKNTPGRIGSAKLDKDSLPDLVVMGADSLELEAYLGPLLPAVNEYRPWSREFWGADSLLLADFTGDGVADPLGASQNGVAVVETINQEPGWPEIFFRKRSGIDWSGTGSTNVPSRVLGAADFDGDGDLDPLFIRRPDETLAWSRNSAGGTLSAAESISVAGRTWIPPQDGVAGHYRWLTQDQVLTTDADGDADIDIITAPSALGNRLALHRNLGAAGFSIEPFGPDLASDGIPSHLLKGSFLSSGEPFQMLAFCQQGHLGITARILKGTGGDVSALAPTVLAEGDAVTVTDFDQDGLDDLICGGLELHFYRSQGDGTFARPVTLGRTIGIASQILAADHDGDGLVDLVVASEKTGSIEIFTHDSIPALPGYDEWAATLPPEDRSPDADADHDGVANILAYAGGMHATAGSTAPFTAAIDVTDHYRLTARFPRPRLTDGSAVEVILQSSPDLKTWQPVEEAARIMVDSLHPEWEILQWGIPVSIDEEVPRLYFRFHVTWQPAP
ncbi:VCBS repeat-containing protein [Luteolibacter sp. GHJ8]|uniref:VCBS repeat-containing protein n=1 Tax=Luteolibacter rhizosphaerae TaxID=2989719 RepID=A0ABT3FYY1_9BACT|nr:VCBS repeat-containing protein [Luteolibacter rhizosphaerae]MCW1912466.1 VCBS repeat-containing protein [Luteolibacter rhizosphaerae]